MYSEQAKQIKDNLPMPILRGEMTAPDRMAATALGPGGLQHLAREGWLLVADVLTSAHCQVVSEALAPLLAGSRRCGARGLLAVPAVAALACAPALRILVEPALGSAAAAVRAVLFDKPETANWRVPWHRDRLIAVRGRREVPGFSAWSLKDHVPHVEPPIAILEAMLTLRIHLDDVTSDNGPLRVISGSHGEQASVPAGTASSTIITAARGSVLLMRPLLLHASSPAVRPGHRRVVQLEYCAADLPAGLDWNQRLR